MKLSHGETVSEKDRVPVPAPSRFLDPVARTTHWGPCTSGGASFQTHALGMPESGVIRFRPTVGSLAFGAAFALAGLGIGWVTVTLDMDGKMGVLPSIGGYLFAAAFGGSGYWMLRNFARPIVFDRNSGMHFRGANAASLPGAIKLRELHALQIIDQHIDSGHDSYHSYELNLVLHDGTRTNVVDHGNLAALREDARRLATFLGVPLWDATTSP